MIKLTKAEKTAIWLDHGKLINEAYRAKHLSEGSQGFYIKADLFEFRPKPLHQKLEQVDQNINHISKRYRKRKAALNSHETNDQLKLKSNSRIFLEQLKSKGVFNDNVQKIIEEEGSVERVWEEQSDFPQMHGENVTVEFHTFSYGTYEYVIPPQCRFFNYDVTNLHQIYHHLKAFDFVVMDPPWRNKYIRRVKRVKLELGYRMLDHVAIQEIPLAKFIHINSIVVVWCTNSERHKAALLEDFFPAWNLRLLHSMIWLKVNTIGELICDINRVGQKQPYEMLFIACHKDNKNDFADLLKMQFLLSIPSIVHSHKPPLLKVFQEFLPANAKCLEVFARYLQPQFTSIGLEVLKLMDKRLYTNT